LSIQYKIQQPEVIHAEFPLSKEEKPDPPKPGKLNPVTRGLINLTLLVSVVSLLALAFYRYTPIRPFLVWVLAPDPGCIPEVRYIRYPVVPVWGNDIFEATRRPIQPAFLLHYGDPVQFTCQWHHFTPRGRRPSAADRERGYQRIPPGTELIRIGYQHTAVGVRQWREGWVLRDATEPQ
jgi:hypothetical protein